MEKSFQLEICSPEGNLFTGEATMVIATALDGELGVLYNHAPMIAALGDGSLRITAPDGSVRRFTAHGGFLEVYKNHVTVITEKVEAVE